MKKNLVLDLDKTIVYTVLEFQKHPTLTPFLVKNNHYTYLRPGLLDFLEWAKEHFEISVWSAGTKGYVQSVVEALNLKVKHLLSADDCKEYPIFIQESSAEELADHIRRVYLRDPTITGDVNEEQRVILCSDTRTYFWETLKPLKDHFPLDSTIIIDDNPRVCRENLGNWILAPAWTFDNMNDTFLKNIRPVLLNWEFREFYHKGPWLDNDD